MVVVRMPATGVFQDQRNPATGEFSVTHAADVSLTKNAAEVTLTNINDAEITMTTYTTDGK